MKRIFDAVSASIGLLLLSVPMLLIACAVLLSMGRPVLFRQVRPGLKGAPFELVKFRTMANSRDADGNLLDDAHRLTRVGRLMRETSLDELPELWNVIRGDMSLVGPRPLLMEYLSLYSREQARRHDVRPGLTGWAQVNGRNTLSWEDRLALDVWYVDNRTMLLDIRILLMTIGRVVGRQGIHHPGEATMKRFTGSSGSAPS